jgi:TatD DNase family protein
VADTARFVAALRELSVEELAAATSANFRTLFSKVAEC